MKVNKLRDGADKTIAKKLGDRAIKKGWIFEFSRIFNFAQTRSAEKLVKTKILTWISFFQFCANTGFASKKKFQKATTQAIWLMIKKKRKKAKPRRRKAKHNNQTIRNTSIPIPTVYVN